MKVNPTVRRLLGGIWLIAIVASIWAVGTWLSGPWEKTPIGQLLLGLAVLVVLTLRLKQTRDLERDSPLGLVFGFLMGIFLIFVVAWQMIDVLRSSGSGHSGGAPVSRPALTRPTLPEGSLPPPPDLHPEAMVIAAGKTDGVAWRLLIDDTFADQVGGLLCLETTPEEFPPATTCAGEYTYGSGSGGAPTSPMMGSPAMTHGEPRFAFGKIGAGVARVVVEMDSAAPIEAEVVGEKRAHYVVALPSGASPSAVVAYAANGKELARRGFRELEQQRTRCWETEDGGFCKGSGSGSGSGSDPRGL